MIDLHCHILPGVDDGAATMAQAVAMARQAEADGIAVVCATPHIRSDHQVEVDELDARVGELSGEVAAAGIGVRIAGAGEVAAPSVEELEARHLATVALSPRWVLLEPPAGALDERILEAVGHLGDRGYRAVIAHPERHPSPGMEEVLARCVERGALVQATAAFVAEGPASQRLVELAKRGLVHVLGSDSHSPTVGRPVRLSDAVARLAREPELRPHLSWIAESAPAAVLRGEEPTPPIAPG